MLKISAPKNFEINGELDIPASKSISNRCLIIEALCEEKIDLENLSISDDTIILRNELSKIRQNSSNKNLEINVGMAGTAFRFLTAFLAIQKGNFILTGHQRLKERPIKPLVDALKQLGADISYLEKEGFAPLLINGKVLEEKNVSIPANISSQFITALLLISPSLKNGLTISLRSETTSKPYIEMTLSLMKHFGVETNFIGNIIEIKAKKYTSNHLFVEADWSSASYFYEILALAKSGNLVLKNFSKNSIQGDSKLATLFQEFGIATVFKNNSIFLSKTLFSKETFSYNFQNEPDLAQTFITSSLALGKNTQLTGLQSLRIKETDRILAIKTEINKLGFDLKSKKINQEDVFELVKNKGFQISKPIIFKTYNDHRMAMCLAPFCLKYGEISIENPEVISKSNPLFWNQLEVLGFEIERN